MHRAPRDNPGTSIASYCALIAAVNSAAGAACLLDTPYAVSYNTANHTVVIPARSGQLNRGSSPDEGAYEYSSSSNPNAAIPSCSPDAGTYNGTQTVTCTDSSAGAIMCYTTNGTTPATNGATSCSNGTKYTTTISVASTETLKVIAGGTGYTDDPVISALYTITGSSAANAPTCSPAGGSFNSNQSATCSDTSSGAIICYTLNGTTPVTNGSTGCSVGTKYTTAISITGNQTLIVIAGGTGYSDSATNSYSFTITTGVSWPIKASGRYLVDQNNNPWLMLASSPQPMVHFLTPAQMGTYMQDRVGYGFNSIWFEILCGSYDGCGTSPSNGALQDGTVPFTSGTNENNYDFSTPNNAYWTEIDNIINQAATYGLTAIIDPFDTGLNPSTGVCTTTGQTGWLIAARANGNTKMYNFGAYLGNRYKNFQNVIWVLGDNFQTQACTTGTAANDATLVAQFMAGLESADPNHLVSIELNYNFSYTTQNATIAPYATMNGIYTYGGTYDEFLQGWNNATIPTYLVESNYEYDNNTGGLSPFPQLPPPCSGAPPCANQSNALYDLAPRLEAWWAFTSGGAGEIYSNWYEEDYSYGTNYISGLDSVGASQIKYIANFFNAIPNWQILVPDQGHNVVTAGYGTYNASGLNIFTNNYVTTAWDPAGTLAVIYQPGTAVTSGGGGSNTSTVNWTTVHQTMDGFGASDLDLTNSPSFGYVFTNAQTDQFYSQTTGIGLEYIRSANAGCPNTGSCTPASTYVNDLSILQRVMTDGGKVFLEMVPPEELAYGGNFSAGTPDPANGNCIESTNYTAYANYIVSWIQYLNSQSVTVDIVSAFNEPDLNSTYTGGHCTMSAAGIRDFIKVLKPLLVSNSLSSVRIMYPEQSVWYGGYTGDYTSSCLNDSTCAADVDVTAYHVPAPVFALPACRF